jgi:GWxTD domain-containing protein
MYYSFYQPALTTVNVDNLKLTQGMLEISITNEYTGEEILKKSWQFDSPVIEKDISENLTGVLRFQLDYGAYIFDIKASDVNNQNFTESHSFNLVLSPQSTNSVSISDIQLASAIQQDSQKKESIFYKNTLEVIPNPSLIYGDNNPVLFFYSEVYGFDEIEYDHFIIQQKLIDNNNVTQYEKTRELKDPHSSIVELGAIKVNELNSGIYTLVISVKDKQNHISANSSKKVYIYNRSFVDQTTSFDEKVLSSLESEIMILSEDQLDYMFEIAEYIATEDEKNQWKKLKEIDAKQSFFSKFWKKRDYDLNTSINEYKQEYYDRVSYANDHFGNLSRKEGWKTDRGRVFLMYGVPDIVEQYQNEYYSKPYEIWKYDNIEGGVIFLFADELGLNIYKLVHSTKKGEIYNYREYQKYVQ